jgi:hypothetical protein
MNESNGGLSVKDQRRDLMIQAAVAYDETQMRIASLEGQLNRAVAALEAKKLEIDNLNLLLSQERNRNDNHRNERDQAVAERAEVLAILSNFIAHNGAEQLAIEGGGQSGAERRLSNADASRAELAHSHLYWHTERHCWDVTPVEQYRRHVYVLAVPAQAERQTTQPTVNYQLIEKDGGTVVKPAAKVTTYYPSLMKGQNPEPEWLTPTQVIHWPLMIDIDSPNRFEPWERRISGIMN